MATKERRDFCGGVKYVVAYLSGSEGDLICHVNRRPQGRRVVENGGAILDGPSFTGNARQIVFENLDCRDAEFIVERIAAEEEAERNARSPRNTVSLAAPWAVDPAS